MTGDTVTLTLAASGLSATGVTVTGVLPSGLTVVSVTPPAGGSCSSNCAAATTVTCTLPSLSGSAIFTIVATASAAGTLKSVAGVVANEYDPTPSNNTAVATVTVTAAPAPIISSINPTSGYATGGTPVTVYGSNFKSGATVSFGGTAATGVTFVNAGQLNVTTPAHPAGAVNVVVTNSDNQAATLTNGFTYTAAPAPTVSGVSPNTGPTGGGTPVTITGTNFASGATVTFGGTAATGVSVVNSTTISATSPPHAVGVVNVAVTNPDFQTATLTTGFTYQVAPAPTISGVSPSTGPTAGSTAVTITGTNFVFGASVTFGGTAATGVTFVGSTQLYVTTPAHAAGAVNVVVTNPDNQTATFTNGFTYTPSTPMITAVSPNSGSTLGGTAVTITGTNFVFGASVTFGGTAATGVTFVSSTQLYATTPAHAAGAVNVVVTNPDSQTATLSNSFTYTLSTPTITAVSPNSGSTLGGTAVTITGTNFINGATVSFGGTSSGSVGFNNPTQLIVSATPPHGAGAVNVVVTNPDNQTATLTNGFTYTSFTPTITAVSPNSGSTLGGAAVTITGTNFVFGTSVTFGGTAATGVTYVGSTQLNATTPAHAAGAVNVVVTNPDSQTATRTNGFTYTASPTPTITAVSPNSGSTLGGTFVTITGTNFINGATVSFGGTSSGSVGFNNSTQLIVYATPPHAAGAVNVVVTNPDSQTATLTNGFAFTLSTPTITAVSPNSGSTVGGTLVTITGTNLVNGATVSFGGTSSGSVGFINSNQLYATTPSHAAGAVNVVVTNPDLQTATLTNGFTYTLSTPTNTAVSPNSGSTLGGTGVTIGGTNFINGATVSFGGTSSGSVGFINSNQLYATTPSHAAGAVNVVVTNPDLQTATLTNGFTYLGPAPTVTGINLNYGPPAGGQTVTITGTNFRSGATVQIGSSPATGVIVTSATSITAVTPAGALGAVNVIVTNQDDKQSATLSSGFTYVGPPLVTSIDKIAGPLAGGQTVTIYGAGFRTGATVRYGANPATGVTVVNYSTITAMTPAGTAGTVNVSVTNADGQTGTLAGAYSYRPAPIVSSVIPGAGWAYSQTSVAISGANFVSGASVIFGSTPATNVLVPTSSMITATSPILGPGTVNVTVTNAEGQSGVLNSAFTFTPAPAISSISPSSCSTYGGATVTISGTNFTATPNVTFGGAGAASVTWISPSQVTAVAPAHAAGYADVMVRNPDLQATTLSGGFFFDPAATRFYTLPPCRAIDTRSTSGFPAGYGPPSMPGGVVSRNFVLAGQCGIPSDARSVSINAAVWGPVTTGDAAIFAAGGTSSSISMLFWDANILALANAGIVQLGTGGAITVRVNGTGTVDLILDVNGYFK
jgi:hypothetical protein